MKRFFTKKTTIAFIVVCLALSFSVITIVRAEIQAKEQTILELVTALKGASPEDKAIILATLQQEASGPLGAVAVGGICNGSDPVTQLCNVNIIDLEVEDISITGTSTPAIKTYFPIYPTIGFTASSTIVGTTTQWLVMGYYLNTGDELIVDDVYFDEVTVVSPLFQFDLRAGTTTCIVAGTSCGTDGLVSWTNTTTDTLIASTTVSSTWTTDINGFIDTNTYAGTYYNPISNEGRPTTTQFVLKHGEAILWSWLSTVTSTDSLTAAGKFTGTANAGARARLR